MPRASKIVALGLAGAAMLISVVGLTSCSLIRLHSVTTEERTITPIDDEGKTVTLTEPIVWLDAPALRASKGVRLPQGLYRLEAEDADYWYFRAPSPIEMRLLEDGRPTGGPDVPGGLALAKALFTTTSP